MVLEACHVTRAGILHTQKVLQGLCMTPLATYLRSLGGRYVFVADAYGTRHIFFSFVLSFVVPFFFSSRCVWMAALTTRNATVTCKGCMHERKHQHGAKFMFLMKRDIALP